MANIYSKVPIKVQKKSGFDKSFQNLFTSKVGTITPILCDELIPNTTVNLRMAITTQLPPLASDTFMRIKQKYAAFFVPSRLLMQGYEKWLTGNDLVDGDFIMQPLFAFSPDGDAKKNVYGNGTLLDYLGCKVPVTKFTEIDDVQINAMPLLAYHRIYDDWFRNSLVQKPVFNDMLTSTSSYSAANSKYVVPTGTKLGHIIKSYDSTSVLADGVRLYSLRQANFGYDVFTSCTPQPQNGGAQSVSFDTSAAKGNFTISALRAANSMQQFLERNNLAGNRLVDYVKAQYGANLNDAIAQRPVLIGSGSFDVYSNGIYQTSNYYDDGGSTVLNNPMSGVAARFGNAYVDGQDLVVEGFTAQEPGYLMVVTWLSPKATYSTGLDPMFTRYISVKSQSDMANPILQNVGNEPIYARQLSTDNVVGGSSAREAIFGYNERYANWKDKQDEVHGILRDGDSLQSFALQRTFGSFGTTPDVSPTISTSFLQIPVTYLDQVAAVESDISQYGYWSDTYFDYKVTMPLAKYSIPSLQDPAYEHGEDVVIDKNGKQLN